MSDEIQVIEETHNGHNQKEPAIVAEQEFEVEKILSRRKEGDEFQYEVRWKDGDVTFEPISNLGGAAEALKSFLEANHPEDPLIKMLSNLAESDNENDDIENDKSVNKNISLLAKWHQKTTRGNTEYWLRKGDDQANIPGLLKRISNKEEKESEEKHNVEDQGSEVNSKNPEQVSPILFSEEEDGAGAGGRSPNQRVRKRIRVLEETVKMFPHEELEDNERHERRTMQLWREMLGGVVIFGMIVGLGAFLYLFVYPEFKHILAKQK